MSDRDEYPEDRAWDVVLNTYSAQAAMHWALDHAGNIDFHRQPEVEDQGEDDALQALTEGCSDEPAVGAYALRVIRRVWWLTDGTCSDGVYFVTRSQRIGPIDPAAKTDADPAFAAHQAAEALAHQLEDHSVEASRRPRL